MRAPAFWWSDRPDAIARLLSPIALVWNAVTARRMARPGVRVGVPVICIGNFVAGGAGKTPTAVAIAWMLKRQGETPGFLTRGYGGAASSHKPLTVDPSRHSSTEVGDEALLLAAIAPTVVCVDRLAGARALANAGCSLIVMDDGLQNPTLAKDIVVAVVDGAVGVGNGLCIPAGPLRASLVSQMPIVSAVLTLGDGMAGATIAEHAAKAGKARLRGQLKPDADSAAALRGQKVAAFAGIGRPSKFFATLRELGANVVFTREFADHHVFRPDELALLQTAAQQADASLVTTEKDRVRIPRDFIVKALPVRLEFENPSALTDWLSAELKRIRASW